MQNRMFDDPIFRETDDEPITAPPSVYGEDAEFYKKRGYIEERDLLLTGDFYATALNDLLSPKKWDKTISLLQFNRDFDVLVYMPDVKLEKAVGNKNNISSLKESPIENGMDRTLLECLFSIPKDKEYGIFQIEDEVTIRFLGVYTVDLIESALNKQIIYNKNDGRLFLS